MKKSLFRKKDDEEDDEDYSSDSSDSSDDGDSEESEMSQKSIGPSDPNWIEKAIKKPGALTSSAKSAGMSTHKFAEKHKHSKGKTGKRSRLALTLGKMKHKK